MRQKKRNTLLVLYQIRFGKGGESHAIAETLIKPRFKDLVEYKINKRYFDNIDRVPLSNDSFKTNLWGVQFYETANLSSTFSLQIDDSTDVGLA